MRRSFMCFQQFIDLNYCLHRKCGLTGRVARLTGYPNLSAKSSSCSCSLASLSWTSNQSPLPTMALTIQSSFQDEGHADLLCAKNDQTKELWSNSNGSGFVSLSKQLQSKLQILIPSHLTLEN